MLLPARIAQGVRQGSITLAYRRWEQPRVRAGGTQLTSAGIVRFDEVEEVTELVTITDADARAAGFADAGALCGYLTAAAPEERSGAQRPNASRRAGPRASKGGDRIFRIRLSWVGEDPRVELRSAVPGAAELAEVTAAVAKLDAGRRSGPWTRQILEWIRDNPGVISTELATLLRREVPPMKADIRRLKALGLTESLRIGYRLSPRGAAYLESLG
ncbi:MAG TPA: hypothetical protein VK903_13765 [Propionicimonas sp.]|nr:hypothetical protein [Propionicimonas sp.]